MLKKLEVPIPFVLGLFPSASNVVCLEEALPRNIQWLTLTDDLCCQQEWERELEYETPYSSGALQSWLPVWKKIHTSPPRTLSIDEGERAELACDDTGD
jgi:hypothetical protein